MARGAPTGTVGTGTATLRCAAAADAAPDAFADTPDAGFGAGLGHLACGRFAAVGRAADFFATGAARDLPLAGAAFLAGTALRAELLATGFFLAVTGFLLAVTGFLGGVGFFLALALPFAGAARRAAGLAAGRAPEPFPAGFLEVFLAAGVFTGSPRNGAATLSGKARREGAANFGRGGL